MIGEKYTNNLANTSFDYILEDPLRWATMRNLAYASIRDKTIDMIKNVNENSADTFINAESLIQNLKNRKTNQYIEAGKVVQNIDLTNKEQLNQIFMNSNIYQNINFITRNDIINKIVSYVKTDLGTFFNFNYAIIHCYKIFGDYVTMNYSFNVKNDALKKLGIIYNEVYDEAFKEAKVDAIDNIENIKDNSGYNIKFPKLASINGKINQTFGSVKHLIYYIDEKISDDFDDVIIFLNIADHNIKHDKIIKEIEVPGDRVFNTMKSYDTLNLYAVEGYDKVKYGKMNGLFEVMKLTKPMNSKNKLFLDLK